MTLTTSKTVLDSVLARFDTTARDLDALEGDQTALAAELLRQEEELRFPTIGYDAFWTIGSLLQGAASARELPVAINIQFGTQQVFHSALAGAVADNDAWAGRKTAVVQRYGHSSAFVGYDFANKGEDFDANSRLPKETYAAHGGAFPLALCSGVVVGVAAVSGLPSLHDHSLVVAALGELLASDDYLKD